MQVRRRPVLAERKYPLLTDQGSGRIILARSKVTDAAWVCRNVGAELAHYLHEFWDSCDQRTLEWTAYAHLMSQCGLRPRPLKDLAPLDVDTSNSRDAHACHVVFRCGS